MENQIFGISPFVKLVGIESGEREREDGFDD